MSASSVLAFDFGDWICAVESIVVRTDEASNGIGSSGLVECERKGTIGLYGSECSRSFGVRLGASEGQLSATMDKI